MHISVSRPMRVAAVIAASAALGMGALTGTASASTQSVSGQPKYEHCVIMLAPVQPKQSVSHVISRTCSNNASSLQSEASTGYVLVTLYQYTDYKGATLLLKSMSPCPKTKAVEEYNDTQPVDYNDGNWGASSWKAGNSCWRTEIYYYEDFAGPSYLYAQGVWEAAQIGSGFDNHVESLKTAYQ